MSENNFQIMNARITFRNVPLHKLANFSFKDVAAACKSFTENAGASECLIVQTSSRIEVFTVGGVQSGEVPDARRNFETDGSPAKMQGKKLNVSKILSTWSSLTEMDQFDLDHWDQTLEIYKDSDVYEHVLRLACGLESLVVGKDEIVEELKKSISIAKESKTFGKILDKLFNTTLRVATSIRDSTGIGKEVITIGDTAAKIAEESMGDIGSKHVLLIGTGETAGLVAKSLNKNNYAFDVTSKTIERATGFSKMLGGKPIEFKDVMSGFDKFDIIFVATTADAFLITFKKIEKIMNKKKKGTLIMDLSEPRTVDEQIATIKRIKLVNPSQINEMVEDNTKKRKNAVSSVEEKVKEEIPIIEATMKRVGTESLVSAS
ncbi:glutamyl-tRNA reductase [Marine Group I thaumarchaeote]|uniref:Glutamyl-tRNA reductase n=2 Tax=Nitrososphaerota TaxID=651137 RepID=A0A7K4NDH7_9ARCH|nr:glutamyl-tRNA reductase [Marine Group I thaumarchaeote]NWJ99353.1 glutamyl-tRNA reductase [Marine Group I thaumarchaeote]PBO83479.1 MAG: glutamyl-tRNA reductase [Nitrosopumilales archaeon]